MDRGRIYQFVRYCCSFNGIREGTEEHKRIIDTYNRIRPLPAGYEVKYTDPWCCVFVSFCFRTFFPYWVFPYECSCERMLKAMTALGRHRLHVRSHRKGYQIGYEPVPGDVVFYNFTGVGAPTHTGIVISVDPEYVRVVEGNYSDSVGIRQAKKTAMFIYGYFQPFEV